MRINVVADQEDLKNIGDAWVYTNDKLKCLQLAIICPGCGQVSASAGKHKYDPSTQTYTPSIVHHKEKGGCGWHGTITNGIITTL